MVKIHILFSLQMFKGWIRCSDYAGTLMNHAILIRDHRVVSNNSCLIKIFLIWNNSLAENILFKYILIDIRNNFKGLHNSNYSWSQNIAQYSWYVLILFWCTLFMQVHFVLNINYYNMQFYSNIYKPNLTYSWIVRCSLPIYAILCWRTCISYRSLLVFCKYILYGCYIVNAGT